jgi:hypothetical protein
LLSRHPVAAFACRSFAALLLLHCSGTAGPEATAHESQAILGGTIVTDPTSPFVDVNSPNGQCSGTLIAPNLVVTAKHCVARTTDGNFTCSPEGNLQSSTNGAGQIGALTPAGSIDVFTNKQVIDGTVFTGSPAAVGAQIVTTPTVTVCSDDIAFVVLDRSIPGVTPASVRIDGSTVAGEPVDLWGYGLTDVPKEAMALRVRRSADVVGVGPDIPQSTTAIAPLRAVRLGPDDITCNGDSGGPITSSATGALIAVASLGNEADLFSPACKNYGSPDTTGPRLGAYNVLTLQAFAAAGATPILEPTPDAGAPVEAGPGPDAGPVQTFSLYTATGGACSAGSVPSGRSQSFGAVAMTFAWAAGAVGRRRR